jgi:hypothetical protein
MRRALVKSGVAGTKAGAKIPATLRRCFRWRLIVLSNASADYARALGRLGKRNREASVLAVLDATFWPPPAGSRYVTQHIFSLFYPVLPQLLALIAGHES